jgi:indole-3-glycerol phosphate synthase
MTILENIINNKRKELVLIREQNTFADLEKSRLFSRKTISLSEFLSDPVKTGIITEFKRMSPSKGIINSEADVREVTQGYAYAGASGLSILTDKRFFGGSTNDIMLSRELNSIPILRKDFIIDRFQILESKAAGADAILLIAAALDRNQIFELATISHSLGMEVVLEVHSPDELEMVNEHVNIIGVNNRDLKTFGVNVNISAEMADKIPEQFLKISESGISSSLTVKYLREAGYNGFLIGEFFMSKENPASAFADFVKEISRNNAEN